MPKLQSFPEFDSCHSATLGDDHRIVLMKGALLSELVRQPRILTEYMQWTLKTGLHPLMEAVLDVKESVTKLIAAIPSAAKSLQEDAVKLAAELNLPYRWVAQGLLHGFGAGLVGIAMGEEIVLPLPQINLTYDPLAGRATGYKPDAEVIERYARWYVRCRISGVKESTLAQEYHETHAHLASSINHTWREDRKTISKGIKEIERLLRLTK